jgi:dTDP-4-dehydrorhamnose 3,5-epimerase
MRITGVRALAAPEVKVVSYARFRDERGFFTETFRRSDLEAAGVATGEILQINESHSRAGVFRGLHAQWNPWQGKMVRAARGRLVDLAVDLRKGSPAFGRVVGHVLTGDPGADAGEWVWVPPGFAHGTYLSEDTTIEYLCTSAWSPGCEVSLSPFAPDLDWSECDAAVAREVRGALRTGVTATEKDRRGLTLGAWLADPRSDRFVHDPRAPFGLSDRS